MKSGAINIGSDETRCLEADEINVLGSSSDNFPPPYHTFEMFGYKFVYDTSSCKFLLVDDLTYRFLSMRRDRTTHDVMSLLEKEKEFSKEEIADVASEINLLRRNGLFDTPDYSINSKEMERQLARRYTQSWNKLELALSEICNLACRYCYCGTCRDITPNQGVMSESIARQAITWLFAMSGKSETVSITFFGGEPLMNKRVLRFAIEYSQKLAKLHGKKVYYSMTTNGTLLDDEVIDFIKKYNFGLMVSLDGPPALHNKQCPTRGGKDSFDAAVTGIKRLMKRRRSVTVRCTMVHPMPKMMDLIRYFEEFGFTRIVLGRVVNPLNPSPVDCTKDDFVESDRQEREEVIPWILNELSAGRTPKYHPYASFIAAQDTDAQGAKANPFKCGACRGTTTVGADGTLYPCHRFVGMEAWKIGNIQSGPDLERCKQFWRNYRNSIEKKCEACWLWAQCHGPCPWEIASTDGTFRSPDECCELTKNYIERGAYVYAKSKEIDKMGACRK